MMKDPQEYRAEEWLTKAELESLKHYREFHLAMPLPEDEEPHIEVVIIRDGPGD